MFPPLNGKSPAKGLVDGGGGNRTRETFPPVPAPQELLLGLDCTDEEGFRLASLADGEGCFSISHIGRRKPGGGSFKCEFIVKLRADDESFLSHFVAIFGGKIRIVTQVTADGLARAPQADWRISTKAGCRSLVDVFDRYPLWSKKRRDYKIWRDAVIYWSDARGRDNDWTPMELAFHKIKSVREYAA